MSNFNKYNLDDDVDDRTFLANRPNYNKPSSATADFERKQQLILLQKNQLQDSCLNSTRNAISLINESEQIGINTGVELLEQKEKLGRINTDLDTIAGVTRQSQKNINAMNSGVAAFMFNGLKSMFKRSGNDKDKDKTAQPNIQPAKMTTSKSANNFKDNQLNNTINKLRSNSTQLDRRPDTIFEEKPQTNNVVKKDFQSRLDDDISLIQGGVSKLRDLALGLGREIDEQNETLDVINSKAEKSGTTIKVQNKAMLRQLGK